MACDYCKIGKAIILRPKDKSKVCKECFYEGFENDIHNLITTTKMFERGTKVGIGISGGKDSTVLAYVLDKLNKKYDYGLTLVLLCVDEGIKGYRDHSIETVFINQKELGLPLKLISYQELFGLTMDEVVQKIGKKGNCTYCGVFRRQALEEAARCTGVDCIVTGHNADDMAETVLLNLLRGDISRIKRCTKSKTNSQSDSNLENQYLSLSRCKPFKYSYQKEIVFYAYFKKLPYFTTECTYAPQASRGDVRMLIKDLEKIDSQIIYNIIKAGEEFECQNENNTEVFRCKTCNHPTSSSNRICSACLMIERLSNMNLSFCNRESL